MNRHTIARLEHQAKRMRSEYAGTLLATLAIDLDSAIRRAARRLAGRLGLTQSRRTPCR